MQDELGGQGPARPARVVVVDVDMPMGAMVRLLVKWAIASIPAMLILLLIGGLLAGLITGSASACATAMRGLG